MSSNMNETESTIGVDGAIGQDFPQERSIELSEENLTQASEHVDTIQNGEMEFPVEGDEVEKLDEEAEEEEDLLDYDSEADVVVENYDDNDDGQDDIMSKDADSIIDIVSDSEVQEAARQLLRAKPPKILINYKGNCYLLFGEYDGDNVKGDDQDQAICTDCADLHRGCNTVFGRIRLFLQKKHGALELLSRELTFGIPELDLDMEEDNLYNKDVTMNDVVSIFKLLRDNSIKNCEENVPSFITIYVRTKSRFVARYNELVEMISGDATFSNIKVFSNDKSHPVILDEVEQGLALAADANHEVIVMTSDEDNQDESPQSVAQDNERLSEDLLEVSTDNKNEHEESTFAHNQVVDKPIPSYTKESEKLEESSVLPGNKSLEDPSVDSLKRKRDSASLIEDP